MSDTGDMKRHVQFVREAGMLEDERIMRPLFFAHNMDAIIPGAYVYANCIGEFLFVGRWIEV